MKKLVTLFVSLIIVLIVFSSVNTGTKVTGKELSPHERSAKNPAYIVIAWNDLGMHCANKYFGNFCVLPPYNNQHAQIIKVGDAVNPPEIMTTGYRVTYEIPGNTYSVGKTDFWTYAFQLFGVNLANNIGLTGVGLSGDMTSTDNYFKVEGIPVTPYADSNLTTENAYQLTLIKAYDAGNQLLATTQSVIPVSNELNCISSGCHSSEQSILNGHESVSGFNPSVKPILCANCHKDNALNKPGISEAPAFSMAIHEKHASVTNDCYKCHPGPNTQCFRDTMKSGGMTCQNCHGTVANVASSIDNGREAWLQEPSCGVVTCHGANHSPEAGTLYRNSKGHGNLFCSACHGSPHAILPTTQPNDNIQNISLQVFRGTLKKCIVCHGVAPTGAGPHGITATVIDYKPTLSDETALLNAYPNPASENVTIPVKLSSNGLVTLELFDSGGKRVKLLLNSHLDVGVYNVKFEISDLNSGVYQYVLKTGSKTFTKKLIIKKN